MLFAAAAQKDMDRRIEAEPLNRFGDIVHLAVGDDDGAGDPIGRNVGERFGQGAEQLGAVSRSIEVPAGLDNAQFDIAQFADAFFQSRF